MLMGKPVHKVKVCLWMNFLLPQEPLRCLVGALHHKMQCLTLSAPSRFSAEKKMFFFRKFYSYFDFDFREKNVKLFLSSQLIELFHRTMKKMENPAKYELFLPKPLTLIPPRYPTRCRCEGA